MKSPMLLIICTLSLAASEEHQITNRQPREWDAEAYAKGNTLQEAAVEQFLRESKVRFYEKNILDIGCGTGNISRRLTFVANHVHGIDASHNMIEYARNTYQEPNLTFQQAFAESFSTRYKYDLAVTFFCLHWIEDKQAVLKQVNKVLEMDGEFFGTHDSTSIPTPPHLLLLRQLMPKLQQKFPSIQEALKATSDQSKAIGYELISDEEFKSFLANNGFELISYEQQSLEGLILTKEEIEKAIRPVINSRPFMKNMSEEEKQEFYTYFIKKLSQQPNITQTPDGRYTLDKVITTNVFHARKIKEQ